MKGCYYCSSARIGHVEGCPNFKGGNVSRVPRCYRCGPLKRDEIVAGYHLCPFSPVLQVLTPEWAKAEVQS